MISQDAMVVTEVKNDVYKGINYGRQLGFFDPSKHGETPITLVGAGAIGSMSALCLAKVGFHNIRVWDDDVVSEENIPNQFYPLASIGMPKVLALHEVVDQFTGVRIEAIQEKFISEEIRGGIVIVTADSMAARLYAYNSFDACRKDCIGFIDGRMGGLVYRLYCSRSNDSPDQYRKAWYPDSAAQGDKCTEKAIIFNVAEIASKITRLATGLVNNEQLPFETIGDLRSFQCMVL